MASPIGLIILCTILAEVSMNSPYDTKTMAPPEWPEWVTWSEQTGNSHLTSLTAELVRDSTLRMQSANAAGKKFEKNLMFKIGAVTASIQSLFTRMISIYKDVSNLTAIREVDWYQNGAIADTIDAISITQSLLHRIRLEKQLFLEITRQDADEKMAEYDAMVSKFGKVPSGKPGQAADEPFKPMMGGMYVPRRSNSWYEDQFDAKFNFDNVLSKRLLDDTLNLKPKKIVAKPKKRQSELKNPVKMAAPGPQYESRRAGNQSLNPYSDLYRLLGESGASRHQPTLLKLIPPSGRQPGERQGRVMKPSQREAEQKPSRRNSDGSLQHGDISGTFQNINNPPPKKTPLWQAPTNIQHPYASNPTINKQLTNNPHSNDNTKTSQPTTTNNKLKQVTNNKMAPETKRLPSHSTKSKIHDNKSSSKMSSGIIESSTQTTQKNAKTNTQQNSNLRLSNDEKTVTKRAPIKNNAELSTNRQEYASAITKKPIWQPGRNPRRTYDNNVRSKLPTVKNNDKLRVQGYGESRGERSVKQYWTPENNLQNKDLAIIQTTVKNNAEVSVQGYGRERRKRPLWQPGQHFRRSFDDAIQEPLLYNNDQLSVRSYHENRGERANRPNWRRERNHPSPWLYHNSDKKTVQQTTNRNNYELSASVKSPIWQPGQHFRRSLGDNEDEIKQHIRNNAKLSVPQNYRINENRGERSIRKLPEHLIDQRSFMYEQFVKQQTDNNAEVSVKRNFDRREVKKQNGGRSFWQPGQIGARSYYDNF